jgi:hypothetical protein
MKWSIIIFCFVGLLFFDCSNRQEDNSFSYGGSNSVTEEVWVCGGNSRGKYHKSGDCYHLDQCGTPANPVNKTARILKRGGCITCYGYEKEDPHSENEIVLICNRSKIYHSHFCYNFKQCNNGKEEMTEKEAINKTYSKCESCYGEQGF